MEITREAISYKQLKWLRKKYKKFIKAYCAEHNIDEIVHEQSNKVWICWLQGMENAPEIVQKCYCSVVKNMPNNRQVIVLTEDNYRDYITFPDYIQKKIDNEIITKTHFSDLLRVALLNQYGGTWIDATVFISGADIPKYMLNSPLFMFQMLNPGLNAHPVRISSWFMTAYSNHPILMLTQSLLYEYWKKNNQIADYFLLHDFVELSIEAYPREWNKVVPFTNSLPHILLLRLFEKYDQSIWEEIQAMTPIHKMTYKFNIEETKKSDTYYEKIFG